jgi:DNA mismatch repair protein MutS
MNKIYVELYQQHREKYGPKTAIFLLVGSFYELYDIQDSETGETQANVRDIVDYLGIQLTTKKDEVSPGMDGLDAGFPDYVLHKMAGRLTTAGWTVVVVDQVKDIKGKVKERKVSRILSPSTHVEHASAMETPYVATLFFEEGVSAPMMGVALLDATTGSTQTYAGQAKGRIDIWTADDVIQLLSVCPPKEVVIQWKGMNPPEETTLRRIFGFSSSLTLHLRHIETLGSFAHPLVRAEYLQKMYDIRSLLPPRTYLGLRSDAEEYALLYLLQFMEEHYPMKSFHRNEPWIPQARLICGNHALTQLQMTGQSSQECVIGLFDKCITVMGKRAIKERLLSPYASAQEIRSRLTEIQDYMVWPESKQKALDRHLRFMFDLPRIHRKVQCGTIQAAEIAGLLQTYESMYNIMTQVVPDTRLVQPFKLQEWYDYTDVVYTHFSEEKAKTASADQSALETATYPDVGEVEANIQKVLDDFVQIRKKMAIQGGLQEDAIRLETREKEPYGMKGSTITIQQLKKNMKQLPDGTKLTELKSGGWIDCTALQQANTKLLKLREQLENLVRVHMVDACLAISNAGQQIWQLSEHWVCHVDGTQCIAKVSIERGFTCPVIEDVTEEAGSGLEIIKVRHPLVEASASRVSYVKHDVSLNAIHPGENSAKGWLIYGMNASGKSTLMKATGLCVLLAQAGCFVPAQSMRIRPYQAVYTRILNQDNLFAGLSSFAVEMSELRDILRNANPYTLVLGDELCAGTESISAQALVASGIQWLSKRGASFMFATHLHDLPTRIDLEMNRVEVWHLHVEYDPITKKLVYDRTLRKGSGSTLYGLEVARAMDLPAEFIEQALENRRRIMGSVTQEEATSSSWNREIVRRECEVCKKPVPKELEVHHIKHRAHASEIGQLDDGTHMNDKRNLIVICQECHDRIHAGQIQVGDVQQTSDGPMRVITTSISTVQSAVKKGKWSDEELQTVKETLQKYSSLSLKVIRGHLSSKHSIEISEGVLGKMKKEING